jgi:hypothetical protein
MWRLIQSTLWETKLAINRSDQSRQQRCAGSASAHGTSQLHSRKTRRSGAAQKEFYSIRRLARSAVSIADICNTNVTTTLYYGTHFSHIIFQLFFTREHSLLSLMPPSLFQTQDTAHLQLECGSHRWLDQQRSIPSSLPLSSSESSYFLHLDSRREIFA